MFKASGAPFVIRKINAQNKRGVRGWGRWWGLTFSLLGYFFNTKKMRIQNKQGLIFSLLIIG